MLAIEKIRRVFGIRHHRRKPGKRTKDRRGPLPTVADEIVNAPRARARGERANGDWVEMHKVKIPALSRRRSLAPWIRLLDPVRGPKRGAVIFGFSRQAAALPAGIGLGLGLAHIDGPVGWKWSPVEHSDPESRGRRTGGRSPERGVRDPILLHPRP